MNMRGVVYTQQQSILRVAECTHDVHLFDGDQ